MTTTETVKSTLAEQMHKELLSLLSFWADYTVDEQHGGFLGAIDSDMTVQAEAPKGLVLNARILWTFARGYRVFQTERYLHLAQRAYDYLTTYFYDPTYGGYYWAIDYKGQPLEPRKHIYGQAFTLYALSEFYLASGSPEVLEKAKKLYAEMEAYSYDPVNKGYYEAFAQDWSRQEGNARFNIYAQNDAKSMNSHLHIMEAYTNLLRAWDLPHLRSRLKELIEVTLEHIVVASNESFALYFDAQWQVTSHEVSPGHDIEGSWLLDEAAHVLGDEALLAKVKKVALEMAEAVLQHGVDTDGAVWNETDGHGKVLDADKDWWPQAEAVVGFVNAYTSSGEEKFLEAAVKTWDFIETTLIDREHGEWHGRVSQDRVPYAKDQKVNAWKCPYHNSRACFEVVERFER
ncbi:AGE family epimerase/isomerase [Paenibacillus sp. HWE-109]|uniref:AGE family epimerase/isomerase n=1 Tax=Paenibacillus sp. HWE-109 TaxID=1306526 RepID=UPI001EDFF2E2|nr:AGE family epimerase/isomerase [Paenibacillus sp. HWE-109]UKS26788.1 AGE family epimerase/isomerase [Paenibacillus sp. HWE-109]